MTAYFGDEIVDSRDLEERLDDLEAMEPDDDERDEAEIEALRDLRAEVGDE
jgi:hypothetical protein